jgi:glucose-6-phosphate-specific signal transduction histidine kinase
LQHLPHELQEALLVLPFEIRLHLIQRPSRRYGYTSVELPYTV